MQLECMTALPQWGLLEIAGSDAKTFLQGQITYHMGELSPDKAQLAGHCNLKGRLESLFFIMVKGDNVYSLMMPREMIPHAIKQFKKYALFSKVTFTDCSESMPLIGVFGQQELHLPSENYTVRQFPGEDHRRIVICHDIDSFVIYHPEDLSLQWEKIDIEAGFPMIYPTTIDTFLPHHLNLDALGAISFNKGCYLGQEIIARMHYKGTIRKHLYKKSVDFPTTPLPGASLPEGTLVRALRQDNSYLILAIMKDD